MKVGICQRAPLQWCPLADQLATPLCEFSDRCTRDVGCLLTYLAERLGNTLPVGPATWRALFLVQYSSNSLFTCIDRRYDICLYVRAGVLHVLNANSEYKTEAQWDFASEEATCS